jgi:integral membrane protein
MAWVVMSTSAVRAIRSGRCDTADLLTANARLRSQGQYDPHDAFTVRGRYHGSLERAERDVCARCPSDTGPSAPRASVRAVTATLRHPALLSAFRLVAHLEAVSWTGLLVGMFLERILTRYAETGDHLVFAFGSAHGGLVIVYVALAAAVGLGRGWRPRTFALALAAAIPPFATIAFDVWARRTGKYVLREQAMASD